MVERIKIGNEIKFFRGEPRSEEYMLGIAEVVSTTRRSVVAIVKNLLERGPKAYLSVDDPTFIQRDEILEVINKSKVP